MQENANSQPTQAATETPAKKKPTRLANKDIMRLGEWLKQNGGRYIAAGISAVGVGRAASQQLGIEATATSVQNIGAAVGVVFPEQSSADRLAKLEDVVIRQLQPTNAVPNTAQQPQAKAA